MRWQTRLVSSIFAAMSAEVPLSGGGAVLAQYTPTPASLASWITSAPIPFSMPWTMTRGQSYTFSGAQLHGLSAGVSYGDDAQAATDYPLVRITSFVTGHVTYARTHAFSNYSIARGAFSQATLDVPATADPGPSYVQVIANGVASFPLPVTVR